MKKLRLFARGGAPYRALRAGAGLLAAGLLRALAATWRVRFEGPNPFDAARPGPFVLVAWHRGFLIALGVLRDQSLVIPVSRSRDGDWISATLRFMGFDPSLRGSSSDGAMPLLRGLIRAVKDGRRVGFLPDGPRGPAGVAKPGVIALARMSGAALHPVRLRAQHFIAFSSWDRAQLPAPFAIITCQFQPAITVPRDADAALQTARRFELERALDGDGDGDDDTTKRPARAAN